MRNMKWNLFNPLSVSELSPQGLLLTVLNAHFVNAGPLPGRRDGSRAFNVQLEKQRVKEALAARDNLVKRLNEAYMTIRDKERSHGSTRCQPHQQTPIFAIVCGRCDALGVTVQSCTGSHSMSQCPQQGPGLVSSVQSVQHCL